MASYEVNKDTYAIIPKNNNLTIVYEHGKKIYVHNSTKEIMEDSCEFFGSTLRGRQEGTTAITGITHKVPVIVEDSMNIIFFPTSSPRNDNCSWLSLNNIKSYYSSRGKCFIKFVDGKTIELPISYGIINNQILRASRLQLLMDERKGKKMAKKSKKS